MSEQKPGVELLRDNGTNVTLTLSGSWAEGRAPTDFADLREELMHYSPARLVVDGAALDRWDSILMAFLLQCFNYSRKEGIEFTTRNMPPAVDKLLAVATAVETHELASEPSPPLFAGLHPVRLIGDLGAGLKVSLGFVGEVCIALTRLATGRSNTRFADFRLFCYQAGPEAFGIISLTSVLVGMILAYLGAVQLQQFGAEVYVANLVTIGMLREMGVLMTAVVMAGRTGAAYAAQLGTMQSNDEIDAIKTMGISPMEFLVVPRMLALIVTMPLLTLYANVLGMLGGGIVAGGMGINPLQYINQSEASLSLTHLGIGLAKSVVFAILIAVAGCRAGINSGRSSAAVGQAATEAVVTAIVYLIVADAAINILFQQIGI